MANTLMKNKQANRRKFMDHLFHTMEVGREYPDMASSRVGETIGLSKSQADAIARSLSDVGILQRRLEIAPFFNGSTAGRKYHWTLTTDIDTARSLLAELDNEESNTYHTKLSASMQEANARRSSATRVSVLPVEATITTHDDRPVIAVIGPDAPTSFAALADLRKDESFALVTAARQYAAREHTMEASIENLLRQAADLGISIDPMRLRDSVQLDQDDRLESVSLVLPYIDQLERRVSRQYETITAHADKLAKCADLERENKSLREQNSRLIAQRVALAN